MSSLTRRQIFHWGAALAISGYGVKDARIEARDQQRASGIDKPARSYSILPAGSVKPHGWIREQMAGDLQHGIAGSYDKIYPDVAQNVFVKKDLPAAKVPKIGDPLRTEPSWWRGEEEGYWKDAVIRLAFLTNDEEWITRCRQWVEEIVHSQGSDGYIGIYNPESRFQKMAGDEAELWTQSRIFQGMLAYYEFTREERVLSAVERAVHLTLREYNKTYFERPGAKASNGGLTHGVGFGDTLEYLYRITGNKYYADKLVWLYRDYCNAFPSDDSAITQLLNPQLNWQKHAPHLVEALPLPFYCHSITENEIMGEAARSALEKWRRCTTPGGGIVGDAVESVGRLYGTGETYCEYCGITEGLIAANRILEWSGNVTVGDIAERRGLNGAQGARTHPINKAVAYLSRDNQNTTDQKRTIGGRIFYSARHRAAVCCCLNSTRLMPYYVEGMWLQLKMEPGLLANLYGPCELNTRIGNSNVRIVEETKYPFSDSLSFQINPDREVEFCLQLRVPEGARTTEVAVSDDAKIEKLAGMISIRKKWRRGDTVQLTFQFDVRCLTSHDNEYYYLRGPLVYGIGFPEKMVVRHEISINGKNTGFAEYLNLPLNTTGWDYRIKTNKEPDYGFKLALRNIEDEKYPWADPPRHLIGNMVAEGNKSVEVTLVPMGSANLRRVTFPKEGEEDIRFLDKIPWQDCEAAQENAFEVRKSRIDPNNRSL